MSKSAYVPWRERPVHYFPDIMEFIGYGWDITRGRDFDWLKDNVKVDGIIIERTKFCSYPMVREFIKLKGWMKSSECHYHWCDCKLWYVHCELENGEYVEKPYTTYPDLIPGFYPNDCTIDLRDLKIIANPYFPKTEYKMDKIYVLIERTIGESLGHKGVELALMAVREENLRTAITKQAIKDEIEKQLGYFDGDDAIKLEEAVIKLTRGEDKRCIIDDDYLYYLKEVDLC